MTRFDKEYFLKYGKYRDDIKEVKRFKKHIFSSKKVLWIGCGTGKGVSYLNRKGINCLGIDINQYAIDISKIKSKVQKASSTSLPFPKEAFDCVICIDLLEHLHLDDIKKSLSEMNRVSKDKIIIGVTPNQRKVFSIDPTHVSSLSFDEWERLLDNNLPERIASDFKDARYVYSKRNNMQEKEYFLSVVKSTSSLKIPKGFKEGFFFSKPWFRFVESLNMYEASPRFIIVKHKGELVAICPAFIVEKDEVSDTIEDLLFFGKYHKIAGKLGISFGKSLIAYSPYSYDSGIISASNSKNIFDLVCAKMDEVCQKESIPLSAFMYLDKDSELIHCAKQQGYHSIDLYPNAKLKNKYSSFKGYLRTLKKKVASEFRRLERNVGYKYSIRQTRKISDTERAKVLGLYRKFIKKFKPNTEPSVKLLKQLLESKLNTFSFLIFKKTKLVAFSVVLISKPAIIPFKMAVDPDSEDKSYLYFQAYLQPIQYMIENNFSEVAFGSSTYPIKIRLGCDLIPKVALLKFHNLKLKLAMQLYLIPLRRLYCRNIKRISNLK